MDTPIIMSEWDTYDEDATPERPAALPDALTEAMAGTAMTVSEVEDYYGPDFV